MLSELPRQCDSGGKTYSKGHKQHRRGYKRHIDVADGQIPDSQAAIPLATITNRWVISRYDVMVSGHVVLIDPVPIEHRTQQESLCGYDKRRTLPKTVPSKIPPFPSAQEERNKIRTMSERVNARMKASSEDEQPASDRQQK
jgi:hypothetical protein